MGGEMVVLDRYARSARDARDVSRTGFEVHKKNSLMDAMAESVAYVTYMSGWMP